MITINNYIYTNKGILSLAKLLQFQTDGVTLPKVMTFDTVDQSPTQFTYYFTDLDNILETTDVDIYETRFFDIKSNRTVILNCTSDTEIFQYNTLQTDVDPIINVNVGVSQYLISNLSRTRLYPQWKALSTLVNYGNKMCNINLGDTTLRYSNKILMQKENGYVFRDSNNAIIPVFAGMSNYVYHNFVLIK